MVVSAVPVVLCGLYLLHETSVKLDPVNAAAKPGAIAYGAPTDRLAADAAPEKPPAVVRRDLMFGAVPMGADMSSMRETLERTGVVWSPYPVEYPSVHKRFVLTHMVPPAANLTWFTGYPIVDFVGDGRNHRFCEVVGFLQGDIDGLIDTYVERYGEPDDDEYNPKNLTWNVDGARIQLTRIEEKFAGIFYVHDDLRSLLASKENELESLRTAAIKRDLSGL